MLYLIVLNQLCIRNTMSTDKSRWIEILAVVITGLLKFIIMDRFQMRAFYISGACIFWLIYIVLRYKSDNSILKYWGFKKEYFRKSFLLLMPFAVVGIIVIITYGIFIERYILNWHIIPILFLYPVWGLIQQFMVAGLVAGNLKSITSLHLRDYQVVLLTSFVFALVHSPDLFLIIFAFFMQVIFTVVYLIWRNLWSLGLVHGWIATFLLYYILERDLWTELFAWF